MHTWRVSTIDGVYLGHINAESYTCAILYAMNEWPDSRGHIISLS